MKCSRCKRLGVGDEVFAALPGTVNRLCPDCTAAVRAEGEARAERRAFEARGAALRRDLPAPAREIRTLAEFGRTGDEAAARRAMAWAQDPSTNLYLHGRPGAGKTTLAAIIGCLLVDWEPDVPDLTVDWVNVEGALRRREYPIPDAQVLVLDDLGAERREAARVERLSILVGAAYNRGKLLIVTSNYSPAEIGERIESVTDENTALRILRRLTNDGAAPVIRVRERDGKGDSQQLL